MFLQVKTKIRKRAFCISTKMSKMGILKYILKCLTNFEEKLSEDQC